MMGNGSEVDQKLILSALDHIDVDWIFDFLRASNYLQKPPTTHLPVMIMESTCLTKDEPGRTFRAVFPKAKIYLWPDASHFFFVYAYKKFNAQLNAFLQDCLS